MVSFYTFGTLGSSSVYRASMHPPCQASAARILAQSQPLAVFGERFFVSQCFNFRFILFQLDSEYAVRSKGSRGVNRGDLVQLFMRALKETAGPSIILDHDLRIVAGTPGVEE